MWHEKSHFVHAVHGDRDIRWNPLFELSGRRFRLWWQVSQEYLPLLNILSPNNCSFVMFTCVQECCWDRRCCFGSLRKSSVPKIRCDQKLKKSLDNKSVCRVMIHHESTSSWHNHHRHVVLLFLSHLLIAVNRMISRGCISMCSSVIPGEKQILQIFFSHEICCYGSFCCLWCLSKGDRRSQEERKRSH